MLEFDIGFGGFASVKAGSCKRNEDGTFSMTSENSGWSKSGARAANE
jgi:hypothetical protein